MNNLPQYNLIQAIDTTKVKLPISDRFAKLTLSSNKKQQKAKNENGKEDEGEQPAADAATMEKRESISRNLLKQLSLVNETSSKEGDNFSSSPVTEQGGQNPLLRSESSKDTANGDNDKLSAEEEAFQETMEPLNVTEDDSLLQLHLDDDLEILSQRIASLSVVARPISISSDSTDHLNEVTQVDSVESGRSSVNTEGNGLHIIRTIHVNVAEAVKHDKISLNSEKGYEMTDDEEKELDKEEEVDKEEEEYKEEDDGELHSNEEVVIEQNFKVEVHDDDQKENELSEDEKDEVNDDKEDEDEEDDDDDDDEDEEDDDDDEDPITISDTSESNHYIEPNEMITSAIPSTTQTSEHLELPSMPDDKAERVAAFLRDVSIERRVMEQHGHIEFNDTVDQILDNEAIDKISQSLAKSRQIASADTESMTPEADEEVMPTSIIEREKRLKALDESIAKENFRIANQNLQRLALEETLDNTIMTDDEEEQGESKNTSDMPSKHNSSNQLNSPEGNIDNDNCRLDNETPKNNPNFNDNRRLANDDTEINTETPKNHSNLNNSRSYNTPKREQNLENDHRRFANDDTELNSEFSLLDLNKTPNENLNTITSNRYNSPRHQQNAENEKRLVYVDTEVNTAYTLTDIDKTPKIHSNLNLSNQYNSPRGQKNKENIDCNLAIADTEVNSEFSLTESNKTPKIHSNLNFPKRYNSPRRQQNKENVDCNLANADTEVNSEFSLIESNKTPKIHSNLKSSNLINSPRRQQNKENDDCNLANADTEPNSEFSLIESNKTPKIHSNLYSSNLINSPRRRENKENDQCNLVNADFNVNLEFSLTESNKTPKIHSNLNSSNRYNSPKRRQNKENDKCNLANVDTELNSEFSLPESNKTPKIQSNLNSPRSYYSPKRAETDKNKQRKLAEADTEPNTESPSTHKNKTPKIPSKHDSSQRYDSPKSPLNAGNLENADTDVDSSTSEIPLTQYRLNSSNPYNSPTKHQKTNKNVAHKLANDDTIANSLMSSLNSSMPYDFSKDLKTPDKNKRNMAHEESNENSPICIGSSSEDLSHKSHSSVIINSSSEHNATAPEHSITILETDEDDAESTGSRKSLPNNSNSDENKKLSNSFHHEEVSSSSDDDGQMSQIKMSMASINISAKINIKIHIPAQTSSPETSEDEYEENDDQQKQNQAGSEAKSSQNNDKITVNDESLEHDRRSSVESVASSEEQTNEQFIRPCNQMQLKPPQPLQEFSSPLNKSSDSVVEIVEDEKFLTEAERLLTQLYGKSWQTPDVMRTLKRSSQSNSKTSNNSKSSNKSKSSNNSKSSSSPTKKQVNVKSVAKDVKSCNKSVVEESILGDFSIFRRNIVKTNLDSTRLMTPNTKVTQRLIKTKGISTEPRNVKKPATVRKINKATVPQTERKPDRTKGAKVVVNKGRVSNDRWRQMIDHDSDSEGDNASDDDDADESWSKNASEIEVDNSDDSDFDSSPKPKTRNRKNSKTTKRRDNLTRQLNKSKAGDVVYLDLSKEEVEVQEDVAESPPANHDAKFATHLQDILKTCRHEDKSKLPSSSSSSKPKTKRKLFTPNFGDDDLEAVEPPKEVEKEKENVAKLNLPDDDGIIEDIINSPFDSRGRPKKLDLFNKQLESVKTGKPIFQLTPSPPKKQTSSTNKDKLKDRAAATPKTTKKDDNVKFKTPLTVKSKAPPKTLKEVIETPDYKYSFLKSLDVQVSKSFCHPDALYYRDNYRTKKEDLAKILYDLYNEKLFKDQIKVPITWNKKLLNTAGRCLNKKRLGVRSSIVELSDKVLTSADRLRCTLIHELCHAATWILNGEGGHGSTWKEWARRANATFPELPKIGVCHQYDIEYKYTYKCTLCAAKSHAHSKSKKVEDIRCSYCHGAIEIFLNKKDKDGNILPTPVKEPTGFAKFVKDNYKKFKRDDLKHADVMKLLSSEFATLKVSTK